MAAELNLLHRMAAKGMQFPWRSDSGTFSTKSDVIWGMSDKPGVDVRGRRVVPADLGGGSPIKLPKEITIDIGIDLEEKYGLGAGGDYTGTAKVGKVTVKNGQVTFNGQPLGNQEQQAITAACRNSYKK